MTQTPAQRVGYALGISIAQSLTQQGLTEFDADSLLSGLTDAMGGKPLAIDPSEVGDILNEVVQRGSETRSSANKDAGEAFLAKNGERNEVTVLASGLQYEVMASGAGRMPGPTDRVTTHYHGTLVDGTVFDSSVERGQPASFGVNQVIKGWTEALQLMKEGDKWRLFVPQGMAYGSSPRPGGPIEPFCALIFEVELISVG